MTCAMYLQDEWTPGHFFTVTLKYMTPDHFAMIMIIGKDVFNK